MKRPSPAPLALALLLGCASKGPPKDLGAVDLDARPLAEVPALAHLTRAIEGGEALAVADLYAPEGQPWADRPDPSAFLAATLRENPERAHPEARPLRVLSYNVALLDARLFRLIPYKQSPYLDERRPTLPAIVLEEGHDIIVLQEIWRRDDLDAFVVEALSRGYLAFHGPRGRYTDGLLTLIRAELVAEGSTPTLHAEKYEVRDGLEAFPGVRIKRGFIAVRFEHPTLGPVHVYNTHLQAWAGNWLMRASQVRQLGLHARGAVKADELAILGGDFNGGSFYASDDWTHPDGRVESVWFDNTLSYGLMAHYAGASDAFLRGAHPTTVLSDLGEGLAVVNDPARALDVPGAAEGWCEDHHPQWLTATDCNRLYFMQYGGTEFPARMDLVWLVDPSGRARVAEARTAFHEPVSFPGLDPVEPSDHLGVSVWLEVAPPGP